MEPKPGGSLDEGDVEDYGGEAVTQNKHIFYFWGAVDGLVFSHGVYTGAGIYIYKLRLGAKPVAQELRDGVGFPYQLLSSLSTDSLAAG